MKLKTYLTVWLTTAKLSIQSSFENRLAAVFFLVGKVLRFGMFLVFILSLGKQVTMIGNYTLSQMIIFYLIFNLFDMFGQTFFRGIYWFRDQVISGEFDFRLVKPLSSLFQALTRQTDILDLPLFLVIIVYLFKQPFALSLPALGSLCVIGLAALIIITAIHIVVAALGVVTTEVDHTIMIYRDISSMARFPVDIYTPFVRVLLTFVVPISLAFTLPAKALLGLVNPRESVMLLVVSLVVFWISLRIWHWALTQYSSASS